MIRIYFFEFLEGDIDPDDKNDQSDQPYTPCDPVKIHVTSFFISLTIEYTEKILGIRNSEFIDGCHPAGIFAVAWRCFNVFTF
jgi:hypothetical protein